MMHLDVFFQYLNKWNENVRDGGRKTVLIRHGEVPDTERIYNGIYEKVEGIEEKVCYNGYSKIADVVFTYCSRRIKGILYYSFTAFAQFSEKLMFLTSWCAHVLRV